MCEYPLPLLFPVFLKSHLNSKVVILYIYGLPFIGSIPIHLFMINLIINVFKNFFNKPFFKTLRFLFFYRLGDFFTNLFEILKSLKKIISFLIILPFSYYVVKFQIYIGFFFLLYYCVNFVLIFSLKTEYVSKCEELPLNTSHFYKYAAYNIFVGIPRAKAYIIHYNFFYFLLNLNRDFFKKVSIYFFITLGVVFLLFFFINFSIFIIFGVSYLSVYVSTKTINKIFSLSSYNYESNEALYQTILLNCFITNSSSVAEAHLKKIIFKKNEIIFNIKDLVKKFFAKVKNSNLLFEVYSADDTEAIFFKNHYTFLLASRYGKTHLATNFTSKGEVKIINKTTIEGKLITSEETLQLHSKFNPNLKREDRDNFLVNPFKLDMQTSNFEKANPDMLHRANLHKCEVNAFFLKYKDEKIMEWVDGQLIRDENAPTLTEFSKEHKINIFNKITLLSKFEEEN